MGRVLIAIHSLHTGGAERVALQFARWLLEAGHGVVLLTPARAGADFYPLPAGLERRHEPPLPGPLERLGTLGFPLRVWRLRRLLRRERFDLALGITTLPAVKLLLAASGLGLPVVVAERIFPGATPLALPWRGLRRLTYPQAALHLVQTEAIAAWLRQRRLARRTTVLANAIPWPLPDHPPRQDPVDLLRPEEHLVLAVGTKPHQKGFDRLVPAFAAAAARRPGWRLAMVGLPPQAWPPSWPPLPAGAARPLLPGRVGNLADWYARADLFVLSSRFEGIPNVLLEAMASGCACLAIDCPTGPAELVEHDRNGWLLPACAGVGELKTALEALMDDPRRRQRLGEGARAVQQRFAESTIRRQFLNALAPWLEPGSAPRTTPP
jgi:glycosyltransferase involved in cell wall biosynthesis